MNAETHHTLVAVAEDPQFVMDLVGRLDRALSTCSDAWDRSDNMVILPGNLLILFGNGVAELFKKTLAEKTGSSVDLIPMESAAGSHTLVKMPKNSTVSPQAQFNAQFVQTSGSNHTAVGLDVAAAFMKKAPRPMNSWIIFRDAMHKDLKIEFPELTVQEICKYTIYTLLLT
jgi:transcription factor SOX7/8/10/18 (SOX group E/F)